jgi:Fic-DOC domain mobile mystery protein B
VGLRFEYPEGATPLDPEEASALIPAIATQAELNDFEALNIAEAASWAFRSRKLRGNILDRTSLSLLHKRMFDNTWRWECRFRTTAKNLGVEAWRIPTDLENLVQDARLWVDTGVYGPDEVAARFHHRLVFIHAFVNGNGRHARLATDLLCTELNVDVPTWGSVDLVRPSDTRHEYIQALRMADANDYVALIRFLRA